MEVDNQVEPEKKIYDRETAAVVIQKRKFF